jgi:hypothetical protein
MKKTITDEEELDFILHMRPIKSVDPVEIVRVWTKHDWEILRRTFNIPKKDCWWHQPEHQPPFK